MKNKLYTLEELQEATHTSVAYFKKLIDEGKLKAIHISKNYLVKDDDFKTFLESMEVKQNGK